MGQSTDGILWWGFNDSSGQESGVPEYVVEHLRAHPINHPRFDREREDLENVLYHVLKDYGVELVPHCSSEYTMYGLAVSASVVTARRGYPKQPATPEPTEEWRETLKRAAALLGWPTTEEPSWWLASYWG